MVYAVDDISYVVHETGYACEVLYMGIIAQVMDKVAGDSSHLRHMGKAVLRVAHTLE